jgi:DNA polymerase-3 subunit epsilon
MSSWATEPMLAFDLETTGVNADGDRIATACAAVVREGVVGYQRDWMIAIDVDMPEEASAVNGLTTDHLRTHGRPAAHVIPEIANAVRYALSLGMPIVAYNAAFDLTFLDRECRRWVKQGLVEVIGVDIRPVLDPFVLWKEADRYRRGGRKLTDACDVFGVELGENAHEAAADAIAATRVLYRLAQKYARIGGTSLDELHAAQVIWRAQQCDGLRAHFDLNGIEHDGIPGGWPMLPFAEPVEQGVLL